MKPPSGIPQPPPLSCATPPPAQKPAVPSEHQATFVAIRHDPRAQPRQTKRQQGRGRDAHRPHRRPRHIILTLLKTQTPDNPQPHLTNRQDTPPIPRPG